jgi:hypothetical protein
MMARNNTPEVTGWVGWVYFAGFLMILQGVFQAILGLTALLNDKFYVAAQGHLLVLDYTQWGWIHLLFGVLVIVAGTSVFNGSTWARVVGALLAAGNLVLQFAFVSAYPLWSIILMIIDVLIIYALTVHGGEARVDV